MLLGCKLDATYEDGSLGDVETGGDALTVRHARKGTHGKLSIEQTQLGFAVRTTPTLFILVTCHCDDAIIQSQSQLMPTI